MLLFNNIKELISYQEKCPLCNEYLIPFLIGKTWGNALSSQPIFNEINAGLTDKKFVFNVSHTSPTISFSEKCEIDIITNYLSCQNTIKIFNQIDIRIELVCQNIKCKHNYYILTTPLHLIDNNFISPPTIDADCFNISNKLWIRNLWITQKSAVYSTNDSDAKSIEIPFMKFNSENKDKLINKIKTIVNFS